MIRVSQIIYKIILYCNTLDYMPETQIIMNLVTVPTVTAFDEQVVWYAIIAPWWVSSSFMREICADGKIIHNSFFFFLPVSNFHNRLKCLKTLFKADLWLALEACKRLP